MRKKEEGSCVLGKQEHELEHEHEHRHPPEPVSQPHARRQVQVAGLNRGLNKRPLPPSLQPQRLRFLGIRIGKHVTDSKPQIYSLRSLKSTKICSGRLPFAVYETLPSTSGWRQSRGVTSHWVGLPSSIARLLPRSPSEAVWL